MQYKCIIYVDLVTYIPCHLKFAPKYLGHESREMRHVKWDMWNETNGDIDALKGHMLGY